MGFCVLNRIILKIKVGGDTITVASFLLLINCLGPECSSQYVYIQGQGNKRDALLSKSISSHC